MAASNLTQMKSHAMLIASTAKHSDSEIGSFLKVARTFVLNIRNE